MANPIPQVGGAVAAPDPVAAEEIPNQPMPAPEQAADAGTDNETSNQEGEN